MICKKVHSSDIETENDYITVLNNIILAFGTNKTLFLAGRHAALFNERFIGHNFRTDKPALEIRVNFTRRTGSFCSLCYRPCTNLVRPRGQEADEPEQFVTFLNELVQAALPNAEILDKSRLFFIRKLGKFLFNLCAYGQRSRTFFCGFVIKLLYCRRFIADFIFGYIRGIDNGLVVRRKSSSAAARSSSVSSMLRTGLPESKCALMRSRNSIS